MISNSPIHIVPYFSLSAFPRSYPSFRTPTTPVIIRAPIPPLMHQYRIQLFFIRTDITSMISPCKSGRTHPGTDRTASGTAGRLRPNPRHSGHRTVCKLAVSEPFRIVKNTVYKLPGNICNLLLCAEGKQFFYLDGRLHQHPKSSNQWGRPIWRMGVVPQVSVSCRQVAKSGIILKKG